MLIVRERVEQIINKAHKPDMAEAELFNYAEWMGAARSLADGLLICPVSSGIKGGAFSSSFKRAENMGLMTLALCVEKDLVLKEPTLDLFNTFVEYQLIV